MAFCPTCGYQVSPTQRFCPECSTKLTGLGTPAPEPPIDASNVVPHRPAVPEPDDFFSRYRPKSAASEEAPIEPAFGASRSRRRFDPDLEIDGGLLPAALQPDQPPAGRVPDASAPTAAIPAVPATPAPPRVAPLPPQQQHWPAPAPAPSPFAPPAEAWRKLAPESPEKSQTPATEQPAPPPTVALPQQPDSPTLVLPQQPGPESPARSGSDVPQSHHGQDTDQDGAGLLAAWFGEDKDAPSEAPPPAAVESQAPLPPASALPDPEPVSVAQPPTLVQPVQPQSAAASQPASEQQALPQDFLLTGPVQPQQAASARILQQRFEQGPDQQHEQPPASQQPPASPAADLSDQQEAVAWWLEPEQGAESRPGAESAPAVQTPAQPQPARPDRPERIERAVPAAPTAAAPTTVPPVPPSAPSGGEDDGGDGSGTGGIRDFFAGLDAITRQRLLTIGVAVAGAVLLIISAVIIAGAIGRSGEQQAAPTQSETAPEEVVTAEPEPAAPPAAVADPSFEAVAFQSESGNLRCIITPVIGVACQHSNPAFEVPDTVCQSTGQSGAVVGLDSNGYTFPCLTSDIPWERETLPMDTPLQVGEFTCGITWATGVRCSNAAGDEIGLEFELGIDTIGRASVSPQPSADPSAVTDTYSE